MPKPVRHVARNGTESWRVRFRHNGRQTSETFPTERAANVFCLDLEARGAAYAVMLREQAETDRNAPTLDEVAERFFEWKAKRVRSDLTVHNYRGMYARSIRPTFGGWPVTTVADSDVQEWAESLVGTMAINSVHQRHALLHGIFAYATSSAGGKLITTNPCASTDLPKAKPGVVKHLRPPEWQALHRAMTLIDQDAADLALFLVSSGWRWSEAIALDTWNVDDLGDGVRVTMGRVMRRNAAGQYVIVEDEGKRSASMRTVRLDGVVSEMVRRRAMDSGDLVFTTKNGGQWRYPNFLTRVWNPAVEAAGLQRRPTVHWLRHTHVIWAALAGASLPELQSRIGHASISTTIDVYGRGITDVQSGVLDSLAAMRDGGPKVLGTQKGPPLNP